jgi:hypothetical protein
MTETSSPNTVSVSTFVAVPPDRLYALITDVTRMGDWSPETIACRWLGDAQEATKGAMFEGVNRYQGRTWKTRCRVTAAEPGRTFAFEVIGARVLPVARWQYDLAPAEGGCELTERWVDRRGAFLRWYGERTQGIADRAEHNRRGMAETLARVKAVAES